MNDSIYPIVKYASTFSSEAVPEPIIKITRDLFLDTIGCILAGSSAKGIHELKEITDFWGGDKQATVFCFDDKTNAPSAAFLNSVMGHANDGLLMGTGADFTFDAVMSFYRGNSAPAPFTFVGKDADQTDFDHYLDAAIPNQPARVVKFVADDPVDFGEPFVQFESMLAMLYAFGFSRKVLPNYQYRREFVPSPNAELKDPTTTRLSLIEKVSSHYKLRKIFPDAKWSSCYQGANAALGTYQPPGYGLVLEWGADDPVFFEDESDWLEENLAMNAVS